MKRTAITVVIAALLVSGTALAQTYNQGQSAQGRTMNTEEDMRQQAFAPPSGSRTGEPYLAQRMPDGSVKDQSGRLQSDRFGNVVRGDSCAAHWANCAYDPSRPPMNQ